MSAAVERPERLEHLKPKVFHVHGISLYPLSFVMFRRCWRSWGSARRVSQAQGVSGILIVAGRSETGRQVAMVMVVILRTG